MRGEPAARTAGVHDKQPDQAARQHHHATQRQPKLKAARPCALSDKRLEVEMARAFLSYVG
ncbi:MULTISPECIES: hypothetical protein [unclassified Cupriavidus]|uniref:hypothetical protein n=1 Tax=unclassified Cupriavidus TaxID=2640874 RepID=UPI00048E9E2F|nr:MULTISPECIES: hypothetical protein [unclassified Cupriavidus]MBP0639506.1 hypothetical protein [Cupriavidus sp. AcVe19-6a]